MSQTTQTYGFSIDYPSLDIPSAIAHLSVSQAQELYSALHSESIDVEFTPLSPLSSDERKLFSFLGAALKTKPSSSAWSWCVVLNRPNYLSSAIRGGNLPFDEIPSLLALSAEHGAVDTLELLLTLAPQDSLSSAVRAAEIAKKNAKPQTPLCRKIECCLSILKDSITVRGGASRKEPKIKNDAPTDEDSQVRQKLQRRLDAKPLPPVALPDSEPKMRLSDILPKPSATGSS